MYKVGDMVHIKGHTDMGSFRINEAERQHSGQVFYRIERRNRGSSGPWTADELEPSRDVWTVRKKHTLDVALYHAQEHDVYNGDTRIAATEERGYSVSINGGFITIEGFDNAQRLLHNLLVMLGAKPDAEEWEVLD